MLNYLQLGGHPLAGGVSAGKDFSGTTVELEDLNPDSLIPKSCLIPPSSLRLSFQQLQWKRIASARITSGGGGGGGSTSSSCNVKTPEVCHA